MISKRQARRFPGKGATRPMRSHAGAALLPPDTARAGRDRHAARRDERFVRGSRRALSRIQKEVVMGAGRAERKVAHHKSAIAVAVLAAGMVAATTVGAVASIPDSSTGVLRAC